jgi:hypothetical protein
MQLLEQKIESAISKILALSTENKSLQSQCGILESEKVTLQQRAAAMAEEVRSARSLKEKCDGLERENLSLKDRASALESEKASIKERCSALEGSNRSLQARLNEFQMNQGRIEQGILNALNKLDAVENTIIETVGLGDSPGGGTSAARPIPQPPPADDPLDFGGDESAVDDFDEFGVDDAGYAPEGTTASSGDDLAPQFDIF